MTLFPSTNFLIFFQKLTIKALSQQLSSEISVKNISGKLIGRCETLPTQTTKLRKNCEILLRNPVDRVNAVAGQLLIFKVPKDTFYYQEDGSNLKLSLLTSERGKLNPKLWLQFDSKNQEFYGVPKIADDGEKEYLLVAEDRECLTAHDALVVDVSQPPTMLNRVMFNFTLGIQYDNFSNSGMQRRFIERIAQIFGDSTTKNIQIKVIRHSHNQGYTIVSYMNTTLTGCPAGEIEMLRNIVNHQDDRVRDKARETLGNEFKLLNVTISCLEKEGMPILIVPTTETTPTSGLKDDYLLTFVLPAVIILAMLLLASIIACVLHRRRMTGKMELGWFLIMGFDGAIF